jgi:hypothetical protein
VRKRQKDSGYFSNTVHLVREHRRWKRKVIVSISAILVVLAVAAKPGYRAYREYRINQNLAAAQAAAQAGDWSTARNKARSVLISRQGDLDAYRTWTQALCKQGDRRACAAAAALCMDPRATSDDRLETLRVLALQAPQAMAMRVYSSLPKELRAQASFRAAITPVLIRQGSIDLAENHLREVTQPHDDPKVRLELLRVLISRPEVGRVVEAREIFAGLIADKADAEALAALLILGDVAGGLAPGNGLPNLPAWLKHQPQATTLHHLLGMEPSLVAQPENADTLYQAAIKRFLASDPEVLGNWLVSHGKTVLAVSILTEPAKTNAGAYLARLHALLRLNGTNEIVAALAAPLAAADPVELEIVQAAAAAQRGDMIAAASAWTSAMNQAVFDTSCNRFIEIARVAEGYQAKDAAENAWVAAVRLGWGQLPFYRDLLPVFASLAAQGRSEDLLAMAQTLLQFEPRNPDLLISYYYLALLHGRLPPDRVTADLAKMAGQVDKPQYHATLMLAEMLDGQPAAALARLPKLRDNEGVAPMMQAALEGTARVLAGEVDAGAALLKEVTWSGCMRQESIVLRDLLVKSTISGLVLPELKSLKTDAAPDATPAWRKAVEQLQKKADADTYQAPAWNKAVERHQKDQAGEVLPALPAPRVLGADSK